MPDRPFLLTGQMTSSDPTRSPAGTESFWAYTHVPQPRRPAATPADEVTGAWGHDDAQRFADRMQARIEARAPGFGDLVLERRVLGPHELEARNANLVGGAVNGGTSQLHQELVFRPVPAMRGRASTGLPGSTSPPPPPTPAAASTARPAPTPPAPPSGSTEGVRADRPSTSPSAPSRSRTTTACCGRASGRRAVGLGRRPDDHRARRDGARAVRRRRAHRPARGRGLRPPAALRRRQPRGVRLRPCQRRSPPGWPSGSRCARGGWRRRSRPRRRSR